MRLFDVSLHMILVTARIDDRQSRHRRIKLDQMLRIDGSGDREVSPGSVAGESSAANSRGRK